MVLNISRKWLKKVPRKEGKIRLKRYPQLTTKLLLTRIETCLILLLQRSSKAINKQMKNIQLVHEGEDYITISFIDENDEKQEVEITGHYAIQAIKVLGKALHKDSFISKEYY